jgi:crossover junction endodeoxyribonuclease RusA
MEQPVTEFDSDPFGPAVAELPKARPAPAVLASVRSFEAGPAVTLVLPYSISANRYWASRVITPKGSKRAMALTYVTPEAKAYKEAVAWTARAAGICTPFPWRVMLEIQLYPHRPQDWAKRAKADPLAWDDTVQCIDLGNCEKVLSDALQGVVFTDDKLIWRTTLDRMLPDEHGARVVVKVTPLTLVAAGGQEALL